MFAYNQMHIQILSCLAYEEYNPPRVWDRIAASHSTWHSRSCHARILGESTGLCIWSIFHRLCSLYWAKKQVVRLDCRPHLLPLSRHLCAWTECSRLNAFTCSCGLVRSACTVVLACLAAALRWHSRTACSNDFSSFAWVLRCCRTRLCWHCTLCACIPALLQLSNYTSTQLLQGHVVLRIVACVLVL
jgi:hypothetical protein